MAWRHEETDLPLYHAGTAPFAVQYTNTGQWGANCEEFGRWPDRRYENDGEAQSRPEPNGGLQLLDWFPTKVGKGYWEYMNHNWDIFDPKDLPAVKHRLELPSLGKEFLTIYGVVEKQRFSK